MIKWLYNYLIKSMLEKSSKYQRWKTSCSFILTRWSKIICWLYVWKCKLIIIYYYYYYYFYYYFYYYYYYYYYYYFYYYYYHYHYYHYSYYYYYYYYFILFFLLLLLLFIIIIIIIIINQTLQIINMIFDFNMKIFFDKIIGLIILNFYMYL